MKVFVILTRIVCSFSICLVYKTSTEYMPKLTMSPMQSPPTLESGRHSKQTMPFLSMPLLASWSNHLQITHGLLFLLPTFKSQLGKSQLIIERWFKSQLIESRLGKSHVIESRLGKSQLIQNRLGKTRLIGLGKSRFKSHLGKRRCFVGSASE